MKVLVAQRCPTLCDLVDCNPPRYSVHGILQARLLERVAIPFSRGSSWPRDRTRVSYTAGRFFTIWGSREAPSLMNFDRMCTSETTTIKIQTISLTLKLLICLSSHFCLQTQEATTGLLSATNRCVCIFRFWDSSQGLSSLFCPSHLSISVPDYFYYYSSAVSCISELVYLWTFPLSYTFWNAYQILNNVLEMQWHRIECIV